MTNYREILRLTSLGFSQRKIMQSCGTAQKTVIKVQRQFRASGACWEDFVSLTEAETKEKLFPSTSRQTSQRRMPDYAYIRKELLKNGVSKKLLWTEYLEQCRQCGDEPLMYSQFCYYIQQDEEKRRATMHINHKPGEQAEVDWAGDPAHLVDPDTGAITEAYVFVGVLSYSQYVYVEAFADMKQASWIRAHVHMLEYFQGVPKLIVPDNCKTAVASHGKYQDAKLNPTYYEFAEHYATAIIPARVRKPKDKPAAEGNVGNISTWVIAALRNEQFFTLEELNRAIRQKMEAFNRRPFQKKEGSRFSLYLAEELPALTKLPSRRYETAEWKTATVQFNYHISVDGMLYSVPHIYIKKKVDVRITSQVVEVFYEKERIASHKRLHGRKGQYSTITEHMPADHQQYLAWNGNRFRRWAKEIGENTYKVVDAILASQRVEQQGYRSCMGLLKLAEKYSRQRLEAACGLALSYTSSPSYKSVKNLLVSLSEAKQMEGEKPSENAYVATRGMDYYGRK